MEGTVHTPTSSTDGAVLRGEQIEKSYGSWLPIGRTTPVLTGANFELTPGEIVGIVGENGSGKSTLMKILVGVLGADAGSVERGGTIGWCPQEPLLYDRLTVAETFDLFGSGYGMDEAAIREARDRLAERLEFDRYLDYRIDALSGGNRQKVNLAVALMHDPDVLLLDEPYTGFDWDTYLHFWDIAEDLAADGTAIAMISHLIEERTRLDRIVEVRDGVVRDATHDEDAIEEHGATSGEADQFEAADSAGDGAADAAGSPQAPDSEGDDRA